MTKGKFGITLAAIAVLAFSLAFFGYIQALLLILGYVLIAEKNSWLTKQSLQAFYISVSVAVVNQIISWIFGGLNSFFSMIELYRASTPISYISSFLYGVVSIVALVFCIIAITKVIKEQDANLPIFGALADKTLGIFKPKPVYTAPVRNQYAGYTQPAPTAAPAPAPVAAPTAPAQQAYTAPVPAAYSQPTAAHAPSAPVQSITAPIAAPVDTVSTASAEWTCVCSRVNTGKFCASCGAKNPNA